MSVQSFSVRHNPQLNKNNMKRLASPEPYPVTVHQVHEQISFLNQYGSVYLWSNLLAATLFATVVLVAHIEYILLIGIWFVAILAANAMRWMLDLEFKPSYNYANYQMDTLLNRHIMYTTLISTLWGVTGLVLFSTLISVQAIHVVILALVTLVSLPLFMVVRTYRYIQVAALLLPIVLNLSIVGELGQSALAVVVVMMGITTLALAQVLEKILIRLGDLQQNLLEQTNKDATTAIPNRRYFEQALKVEWQRAARSGDAIALLMLDIDHFRLFNEMQGHEAGDQCLKTIAQELRKVAKRTSDVVVRYGSDEFAILLPSTHIDDATLLAERMRTAIEELQISHAGEQFERYITVSIGVSFCYPTPMRANEPQRPTDMVYPAALINAVERALYKAKRGTRNTVVKEFCGDEAISRAAMHVDQLQVQAAKVA
ncbi:MAG: GGDEF domain-containing protein [Thiofilum sp.]|uniref:GGDEF domain-containing protein n=2 Tax=Thiofilum sp. TaxID=2212733 RepID=UPI0025F1AA68|nr:diguanylate cyclase [Thiofilum sp.]MBK8452961.1 GGDEF domain-containing protein [Thiofilum sp.]